VDIRAVVSQGNVIMATWTEDPTGLEDPIFGKDGVWYSYTLLDSPELPVIPLPVTPVSEEDPTIISTVISAENTLSPTDGPRDLGVKESTYTGNLQLPILIGIIPVVMFIGFILTRAIYVRRR
jgi:hypothetical protein